MDGGLVPLSVLRHSFLLLTDCWWLYNNQLKTSRGIRFLSPSDAYVRSCLYLLYTSIKLYYTKALSDQASSLALNWILLLRRPRIPASLRDSATTFHSLSPSLPHSFPPSISSFLLPLLYFLPFLPSSSSCYWFPAEEEAEPQSSQHRVCRLNLRHRTSRETCGSFRRIIDEGERKAVA